MTSRFAVAFVLILCSGGVGCTTLGNRFQAKQAPLEAQTYTLRVESGLMGPRHLNQPMQEGMTVQDALEESGQISRHRDLEIDILRRTTTGSGVVKMPVQFDPGKQRVKFETDYAIHPGDQIVIRPKSSSPIESVAKLLSGSN